MDAPVCDCKCCQVATRSSTEKLAGVDTKCAPPTPDSLHPLGSVYEPGSSDVCKAYVHNPCRVVNSDVIRNIQYAPQEQWCLYACMPAKKSDPVGTACVALTEEVAALARTADGVGKDHASFGSEA
uniref:Uncharacterized protein n=1 Tax=Chromera velia CCMP2878 TaxID=1169474 RepID=A0A0G4HEM9_9ALVE|eukprot:Cvel_26782.t1-p1 / transcript=Cvel_26782.t1 / gene=Cvel_26782 / organism=Chromera_velia_CCMP2878 / gene_product=hypothetical protein / transcript_product=hypothetical protein / location=Cvel_scaffold3241:786-2891(+) / protein_length=125 / sequence_SO=supercontig / SO=protein_coding / is_pseudo=false